MAVHAVLITPAGVRGHGVPYPEAMDEGIARQAGRSEMVRA